MLCVVFVWNCPISNQCPIFVVYVDIFIAWCFTPWCMSLNSITYQILINYGVTFMSYVFVCSFQIINYIHQITLCCCIPNNNVISFIACHISLCIFCFRITKEHKHILHHIMVYSCVFEHVKSHCIPDSLHFLGRHVQVSCLKQSGDRFERRSTRKSTFEDAGVAAAANSMVKRVGLFALWRRHCDITGLMVCRESST
jgi:hypothetical protein